MDNRYFPLFPRLYNGSHKSKISLSSDIVFMVGGEAYVGIPVANDEDRIIGYPAIFGKQKDKEGHIDLDKIDAAYRELTGSATLLDPPLVSGRNADVDIAGHLQAQGITLSAYVPFTEHFAFGCDAYLMRVIGEARLTLNSDAASRLGVGVDDYTSQAQFVDSLSKVQTALDLKENVWRQSGAGDISVYASWYNSEAYMWKCRRVDFSATLGLLIPTGEQADINNIASVPFGGRGHWGCFIMPHLELELRDNLKLGLMGRLSKRFPQLKKMRMPIAEESPLFAPYIADIKVDPGFTFSISPYLVFENMQSGFGAELKYSLTYHETDDFVDKRIDKTRAIKLIEMSPYSKWTQEYATIKIVYDAAHEKDWKYRPVFNFTWNIPCNYIAGENFGKTHGITLGCNINF